MADFQSSLEKLSRQTNIALEQGTGGVRGPGFTLPLFLESAAFSVPELFGFDAPERVERFRAQDPAAGLVSQLIGIPIPYIGYLKATTAIPKIARALDAIEGSERLARTPALATAAKEAARFAPFEGARVASTAVVSGPGDAMEVLPEALINVGIAGGIGGVIGLWRGARGARGLDRSDGQKIQQIIPDFDLAAPAQMQLRSLNRFRQRSEEELLARGTSGRETIDLGLDANLEQVKASIRTLGREIRLQTLPKGQPYVGALSGVRDTRSVNRLFNPGVSKSMERKRFVTSQKDFSSRQEYEQVLSKAGIPENFEQFVQFPRHIKAIGPEQAKLIKRALADFTPIGNGYRFARETDDGLFVMAKRIGEGPQAKKLGGTDEWVLFKTDRPQLFQPKANQFAQFMEARSNFARAPSVQADQQLEELVPLLGATNQFMKELPFTSVIGIPKGKPELVAETILKRLKLDKPAKEFLDEADRVRRFLKEYLAPAAFQFSDSGRARYLFGVSKFIFDGAAARSEGLIFGTRQTGAQGSLWRDMFGAPRYASGGIKGVIDKLNDADMALLTKVSNQQMSVQQARAEGASKNLLNFLEMAKRLDEGEVKIVNAIEELVGERRMFRALENHYMISRTWRGEWRMPVVDDAGNKVFYGSGYSSEQALKSAQQVVSASDGTLRLGRNKAFLADRTQDIALAREINVGTSGFRVASEAAVRVPSAKQPRFFEERTGVGGFIGERKPMTKRELLQIMTAHIVQQNKYVAELATRHKLGGELLKLADEDPNLYKQLIQRINDMAGKQTQFARAQNRILENLVGPYLGANPATKIVGVANTLLFNWQLGMGNWGFPALNAATFMQNVLPHMAFVFNVAPERGARYYNFFALAGADGRPKGIGGSLSILKVLAQSFKELGNPDKVLRAGFGRAAIEGVWDPRFVEEYVGQKAALKQRFKAALAGEEGYIQFMKGVSEFLPAQSEKFSRGHSFVIGHIIGRDFMGHKGERLYQFAKDFTNNTMYLYGTADRARIITGPVGSLFGMFKNWQMHYMAQMLLYTDEALLKGNWSPLLWQTAGTAALGGVGGLPLYTAADGLSRMFSDKSLMSNIYEAFGYGSDDFGSASDAIFLGLPAFLGISLQASASAPGSDIARDASMLFSLAHYRRMEAFGKAVGSAIDSATATGKHPIQSQHTRDLFIRATMPKTFYRAASVAEGEALRSLNTGNPVMKNLSLSQRILYSLSLTPQVIDKSFAVNDELWRDQNRRKEAVQRFGRAWAEAQQEGNYDELRNIMFRTMAFGVDISSVLNSARIRLAKGREEQIARQFDPAAAFELSTRVLGRRQ
jgi:hypothetical protein